MIMYIQAITHIHFRRKASDAQEAIALTPPSSARSLDSLAQLSGILASRLSASPNPQSVPVGAARPSRFLVEGSGLRGWQAYRGTVLRGLIITTCA
ncbi:hypothetical protein O3P69_010319 [Scylla paramamosain]|uniref:Uncharacterized protein n=1 Tax=Scylla paramamosain TaxID=85552 RepID=A0AAW0TT55_SCYPA